MPVLNSSSHVTHKALGERLEITATRITEDMCVKFCKALQGDAGYEVRIVDLSHNDIGPAIAESIITALEHTNQLEQVLLRYNNIGQPGCDALASVVNVASSLKVLDVRGNKLKGEAIRKLLKAVAMSTTITQRGLAANDLGGAGTALVTSALEKNNFVTHLDLRQNDMAVDGATHLASLLERPQCVLKNLCLFGNRLGAEGTIALASGITRNRSLETLVLGNNMFTNRACATLGSAFQRNDTIKHLDLRSNGISIQGLVSLAPGFARLQSLALSSNPLGSESADVLVKTFVRSDEIKSLDLWSCNLQDHGGIRLSGLIAASTSLTELNLAENGIEDSGASAIAKAIMHPSKSLCVLDLTGNQIGNAGATELIEAAEINRAITSVVLQGNADRNRVLHRKLEGMLAGRRLKGGDPTASTSERM